jgi:hypothetical protein
MPSSAVSSAVSYTDLTYFSISKTDSLPSFSNEVAKTTLLSPSRLKGVAYGKVVSMSYLTKRLAAFLFGASFQLMDVISDTYFAVSVHDDERIPASLRTNVLVFLVLSTVLWLLISFAIAWGLKASIGYHDHKGLQQVALLCCLWSLVAFDCPLFLVSLPQMVVKVVDIESGPKKAKPKALSNSVFVLGFGSRSEWKASNHYGLISHLPTFLLEDIPLFILNIQISHHTKSFSFISILSLILSGAGICKKGFTIFTWCRSGSSDDTVQEDGGTAGGQVGAVGDKRL